MIPFSNSHAPIYCERSAVDTGPDSEQKRQDSFSNILGRDDPALLFK
jgi:hypothetical protein